MTSTINSIKPVETITVQSLSSETPSIYSNLVNSSEATVDETPITVIGRTVGSKDELIKNQVQSICEEYGIDFDKIAVSSYENLLKAAEYVKKHPKEIDNKKGKITSPADKILHYMTALNYKWDCIEDFVAKNTKKDGNSDNLIERLIRTKCLTKKNVYTDNEVKEACRKYYNKAIKSVKAEHTKDMTAKEADEWEVKFCSQDFSKLLINTKDSKYAKYLKAMISALSPENIDKAVNAVQGMNAGKNAEQKIDIFEFLTDEEIYLNTSSQTVGHLAKSLDDKKAKEVIEQKDTKILEFSKLLEDERQGKIKLTDEQRKTYQKYLENNSALKAGYIDSKNSTKQDIVLAESEERIQNGSTIIYKDEIKAKAKYISENIPKEEQERYVNFFNKISNGNYSKVLENPNCELNPPVDVKKLTEGAQAELGLKQQQETKPVQAEAKAQELQKQIIEQSQADEAPAIVNNTPKTQKTDGDISSSADKEPVSVADQILNLAQLPFIEILNNPDFSIAECIKKKVVKLDEAMKNFGHLAKSDQQSIEQNYIKPNSETEQLALINKIGSNTEKGRLAIKFGLEDDEKKLDLDFNTRKRLESA